MSYSVAVSEMAPFYGFFNDNCGRCRTTSSSRSSR